MAANVCCASAMEWSRHLAHWCRHRHHHRSHHLHHNRIRHHRMRRSHVHRPRLHRHRPRLHHPCLRPLHARHQARRLRHTGRPVVPMPPPRSWRRALSGRSLPSPLAKPRPSTMGAGRRPAASSHSRRRSILKASRSLGGTPARTPPTYAVPFGFAPSPLPELACGTRRTTLLRRRGVLGGR